MTGAAGAIAALGLVACGQAKDEATEDAAAASEEVATTKEATVDIQPIDSPIITELAYRTYHICEYGMDSIFYVEGDDRAVLIDTGTGVFDIPAFVAQHFGDKPYDVILTHGHVDHAGGMFQFDKVYLNEADWELALGNTVEERQGYVDIMISQSGGIYQLSPDMVMAGADIDAEKPEFLPLNEGDTFDLGGRMLEVFFTPGHTAGSVSFLDRDNRIIFTGDCCNTNTLLTPFSGGEEDASADQCISGLKATAEKLQGLHDAFDRNVNGHVGYARWLTFQSVPDAVIPECIKLCQDILDGTVEGEEATGFGGNPCRIAKSETGVMQIQYYDWQVK